MDFLTWPAVVLIDSLVLIVVLRRQLGERVKDLSHAWGLRFRKPEAQALPTTAAIEHAPSVITEQVTPGIATAIRMIEARLDTQGAGVGEQRYARLQRAAAEWFLRAAFERITSSIYGMQLALLKRLNVAQSALPVSDALAFFEEGKSRYAEIYGTQRFDTWLDYLIRWELIERRGDSVALTTYGRDYLVFLPASARPEPMVG